MPRIYSVGAALGGALLFCSPLLAQTPNAPLVSPSVAAPLRVLGPSGVRREAGTWLLNDSIFASPGENLSAPGSLVFIAHLRRDKKAKLPLFMPVSTRGPLNWATLTLPSWSQIGAAGFDFAALQTQLASQIAAARARGSLYLGWSLPGSANAVSKTAIAPILKRLRAVLDAVAPESALILDVDAVTDTLGAVSQIDALAPFCDAVSIGVNASERDGLWPLKMARRVAEEQKEFDLPIFVRASSQNASAANTSAADSDARWLEFLMGGATGFVLPVEQFPAWINVPARNAGLFAGAVTLEDAAILPSNNPRTLRLAAYLRAAGRIPLMGRLPNEDNKGESLLAVLDNQTTLETLNGLDKAARSGATIYLEGAPDLKNKALLDKMTDMTGTTIEVLPEARDEVLSPDDPWLFGEARGQEFAVRQSLKWTSKTTLAAQTRIKKGENSAVPFVAAKLATDANGLLVAPLGSGSLVWLAHAPLDKTANSSPLRAFYAAIAGGLQGSLLSWKWASVEDEARNGGQFHAAMRASQKGTNLLALWNDADADTKITVAARGDTPIVLDLSSEAEIPAIVEGYASKFEVIVPAHGFRWFTFGAKRATLDKERLTPSPKAKIGK